MDEFTEFEHNDIATLFIQVLEVSESKTPQRELELKVRTAESAVVSLIVWEGSPTATVDWVPNEWYQLEGALVKHWDSHSEINATQNTTAKQIENTIQTEDPTPSEVEEFSPEAGTENQKSVSPESIEPNAVSELYESFRSLLRILNAIIESPKSTVSDSPSSHPLGQYLAMIRAICGTDEYLPAGVEGYGTQQANRVPTTMDEYRSVYGTDLSDPETQYAAVRNDLWITDYQTIETAPLADETQSALKKYGIVEDSSVYVRPVAPKTETPLPIVVRDFEELAYALSLLTEFDSQPPISEEEEGEKGAFPIEAVYEEICAVEAIDEEKQVTIEPSKRIQLASLTPQSDIWTTHETAPLDRCGFVWPPDGDADERQRASCCYREIWHEFERCIWHADTDREKPIQELRETRESKSNRLQNHLPREILAGAILRDMHLTEELMTGVDFRGADFEGSEFTDVYLSYATFSDANLAHVDLTETTASRVSFRVADLTKASLAGLSLYEADFTEATLSETDFTDANIGQATFKNTNIQDAVGVDTADQQQTENVDSSETDTSTKTTESETHLRGDTDATEDAQPEETESNPTELTLESVAKKSDTHEKESIQIKLDKLESRGATREEALSCVSQYLDDEGLYSIPGVGLAIGYQLKSHGITRREELETEHLDIIKEVDGITDHHIKPIVEAVEGLENPVDTTSEPTDPGPSINKNELSEYYESFRIARMVVSILLQSDGNGIDPDDLTHPAVQYYVLLDACISYGLTKRNFRGYGLQHRDRLPFSIDEYRKTHGEKEAGYITDYQKIAVKSYHEETQSWLATNTWLTNPAQLLRPVAVKSGYELPEIVTTKQELRDAITLLMEFPAYPSIPNEVDARDRTIPIRALYQDLFTEVDDDDTIDIERLSEPGQASGEPVTGPVAEATPTSQEDAESKLLDYGKLSHLFRRVTPPRESPIQRELPVFGLEWYQQRSSVFNQLQDVAKYDDEGPLDHFMPRLQDMIHRRFLRDRWDYDYITVFPSHKKGTLSSTLVELAQESVIETSVVYTPLLERTETVKKQQGKSEEARQAVAKNPDETLRVRASLDGETVILVDDICTTGSSLSAGAHLLRKAGASRVVGVTLGFTPGGTDEVSEIKKPDAYASEIIAGVE